MQALPRTELFFGTGGPWRDVLLDPVTEAADARGTSGSGAYATGGGGVVLEHSFGATVLVALLADTPVAKA
jgi:hypothetical protein